MKRKYPITIPAENPKPNPEKPSTVLITPISDSAKNLQINTIFQSKGCKTNINDNQLKFALMKNNKPKALRSAKLQGNN